MEKIARMSEVKDKKCISVKGKHLALFKVKDTFYCIDNTCPHANGPLCEGILDGFLISCPWHSSEFDVRDGLVKRGPAKTNVQFYKLTIKGEDIFIDV